MGKILMQNKLGTSVLILAAVLLSGGCGGGSKGSAVVTVDYSDTANWMSIPEISHEADTVYFYPTAVTDPNEPLIVPVGNEALINGAKLMFARHKPIFSESTNVYAPYYSQTNLGKIEPDVDLDSLLEGAPKTDAYAALDYYFEHYNNGRPFILAGHSQGSAMLRIILKEYMKNHPDIYKRMIAAYVVGYSVTEEYLAEYPHLKFAKSSDDVGVIVSWNTEGPDNDNNIVVMDGAMSINPLNWKLDDTYASADINLGSAMLSDDSQIYVFDPNPTGDSLITPGIADARVNVKRGVVICSSDVLPHMPDSVSDFFGTASYHGGDYSFYFGNVRQNVKTRVDAFLKTR